MGRLCGSAVVVLTWEAAVRLKFSFEMEMKIVPSMSAENPVGKSLFWLPSSNTVILTWFLAKMTWGLLPPVVTLLPHQRASKPLFSRSTSMYAPSHSTVCGALKLWNVASKYKPGSVLTVQVQLTLLTRSSGCSLGEKVVVSDSVSNSSSVNSSAISLFFLNMKNWRTSSGWDAVNCLKCCLSDDRTDSTGSNARGSRTSSISLVLSTSVS